MKPLPAAALASVLVLAARAPAADGVDLEIRSGDQVTGTLDPASSVEVFRIALPSGAKLTVKAKAAKRGAPTRLELRDPMDGLSALGAESGTKTTLTVPTVPSGGLHRILVTSRDGVTTGDYSFSCKWVTPKSVARPLSLPDPGTETVFSFGADGGSIATIDVAAAKGSAALPRLLRIRAPDGGTEDLGSGDAAAAKDRAAGVPLRQSGDYLVFLDHAGAAGAVTAKVTIRPPKGSKRKIDVTSRRIGGDGIAIGRVLGSEGGVVTVPELGLGGGLDDISGSSVEIPAQALPAGTAIFVGTATDVDPKGSEQDLGPSVTFGPDGTKFGDAVTITIPVDLSAVGGDTTQVVVFTRDASGKVKPVPPPYDFGTPGYVSFPSTHFSAYQAAKDLPDEFPATSSLFTVANVGGVPADMTFATDGSDPNRVWYVTVGDRLKDVATSAATPTTPFVVRDYAGQGTQTQTGTLRTDFRFGGGLQAVASDGSDVYVGDGPTVWWIDTQTNVVTRYLGDGTPQSSGDGGPAGLARIFAADDLLFSSSGELLVVDRQGARIRRVDGSGIVSTIAGTGVSAASQDGGMPSETALDAPAGIAESLQTPGVFYIAERTRIRVLDLNQGTVATLAGSTTGASGCVEGTGTAARFSSLSSIGVDFVLGRVVVTDGICQTVVQVDLASRQATVFAGTPGTSGFTPDFSSTPRSFRLSGPTSVYPIAGSIYFLDAGNQRLRTLTADVDAAK